MNSSMTPWFGSAEFTKSSKEIPSVERGREGNRVEQDEEDGAVVEQPPNRGHKTAHLLRDIFPVFLLDHVFFLPPDPHVNLRMCICFCWRSWTSFYVSGTSQLRHTAVNFSEVVENYWQILMLIRLWINHKTENLEVQN